MKGGIRTIGGRGIVIPRMVVPAEMPREYLGLAALTADAPAVTLTFPFPVSLLEVWGFIQGYSGAGSIAQWQFNGDTGTTYADSIHASTSVTATTGVSRAGIRVATVAITAARALVTMRAQKRSSGVVAAVYGETNSNTLVATTAPLKYHFAGIWGNTTALFTSVTLDDGGAVNLLNGTWIAAWGTRVF
jgi:hypothetical protein